MYVNVIDIKQIKKMFNIMYKHYYSKVKYILDYPNTSFPSRAVEPELNLLIKKNDVKKANAILESIFK